VYKYFKLSEEDIELINSTNIVGYKNIIEQVSNNIKRSCN
jgi:hypothetical protein